MFRTNTKYSLTLATVKEVNSIPDQTGKNVKSQMDKNVNNGQNAMHAFRLQRKIDNEYFKSFFTNFSILKK